MSRAVARMLVFCIAVIVVFSVCLPRQAKAAASQEMLGWTEELALALIHSSTVSWERSYFYGETIQTDIALGAYEKVADFFSAQDGKTLGYLLTAKEQPSTHYNNGFVNATMGRFPNGKSFEALVYEEIMKSQGNLMPADLLYKALYLCENDYWLATLTCHNLLKEVAYASRYGYTPILAMDIHDPQNADFWYTVNAQDVLDRLAQLRPPNTPHQDDKIGPWYHMFGVFFVSGVGGTYEGKFMASVETITRWFHLGSDPDEFKEEMNSWAAHTSDVLNDIVLSDIFVSSKYLERRPVEKLQESINVLREKYREVQDVLVEWNDLAQRSVGLSAGVNVKMDYLRAYQSALAEEIKKLQAELDRR